MSVNLPNGSTVHIATKLAAAKKVTAATNAKEAVLTCAGHGLQDGDHIVFYSGWNRANGKPFKVKSVAADNITLQGFDTSDLALFPADAGVGTLRKIESMEQITQIVEYTTNGGEQQFVEYGFLEDNYDRQMPSTKSAMSISISIADDPTLAGYQAVVKVSDVGGEWPLIVKLKNGGEILYNGYPSINTTPTLVRNEIMAVKMAYALSVESNRI